MPGAGPEHVQLCLALQRRLAQLGPTMPTKGEAVGYQAVVGATQCGPFSFASLQKALSLDWHAALMGGGGGADDAAGSSCRPRRSTSASIGARCAQAPCTARGKGARECLIR